MIDAARLQKQIAAFYPAVTGVTIRSDDKSTWQIDYSTPPSPAQLQTIQGIIDAFDPLAPDPDLARQAAIRSSADRVELVNQSKTATNAQIDTWVDNQFVGTTVLQLRAEMRAFGKKVIKAIALDSRN